MADINLDFSVVGDSSKYAIVCRNKFEVLHCIKALYARYPAVKMWSPKRYTRIVMSYGMPTAISPHAHALGNRLGFADPELYSADGFQVVEFSELIARDIDESDIPIEEFLGLGQRDT